MVISIRNDRIPENMVIMTDKTCCLNGNFAHECTLYSKYIKGVPNSCTNPGTCVGSSSHCHGNSGAHSHSSGTSTHVHTATTSPWPCPIPTGPTFSGSGPIVNHGHSGSTPCSPNPVTVGGCSGAHTHPSGNNSIRNTSIRFIKKTAVTSLRENTDKHAIFMWDEPLACLPCNYSVHSCLVNEYIKGVANACATPLTICNPANHVHCTSPGHCHPVTVGAHTHTGPIGWGGASPNSRYRPGNNGKGAPHTHSHGGSVTTGSGGSGTVTMCGGAPHGHCCASLELNRTEIAFIQKNSISMRQAEIVPKTNAIWLCTLASIPSQYNLMNGCNCTTNLLDEYIKGVPTACTNPGTQTGSNTHTHSSSDAHCSVPFNPHTHPTSGTVNNGPPSPSNNAHPSTSGPPTHSGKIPCGHSHPVNPVSNAGSNIAVIPATPHTHTTVDHKPCTTEVAFVKRF